jgi:hypothetical protein
MEFLLDITVTPKISKCINLTDERYILEYKHLLWIGFMSSLQFLLFLDIGLIVLQYSTFRHPFIPAVSHEAMLQRHIISFHDRSVHNVKRLKLRNASYHSVQSYILLSKNIKIKI